MRGADPDRDPAGLGELHGIRDQIDQDLLQPASRTGQLVGHGRVELQLQLQAFGERLVRQQLVDLGQERMQVEVHDRRRRAAGLEPGDLQHVVDQLQQRLAGIMGGPDHAVLLGRQGLAGEQLGHAHHGMERRAQLVAHAGEEAALGAASLLRPVERVGQLGQQGLGVERDRQEGDAQAKRQDRLAAPMGAEQHHRGEAQGAHGRRGQQIALAVAKAHAERDPEIERKEQGAGAGPQAEDRGDRDHVEAQPAPAPGRIGRGRVQQMAEQQDRAQHIGDGPGHAARRRERQMAGALGGDRQIDQRGGRDRDPDENLLMLAIGPAGEAAADAMPEHGQTRCWLAGHGGSGSPMAHRPLQLPSESIEPCLARLAAIRRAPAPIA